MGDDPDRIGNEAQFAALLGTTIPPPRGRPPGTGLATAATGAANAAIHHVVVSRMASDQRTKDCVARRTEEGKTKKEIMRSLKRYVSREIYNQSTNPHPHRSSPIYARRDSSSESPSKPPPDTSAPGQARFPASNEDSAARTPSPTTTEAGSRSNKMLLRGIDNYRSIT